MKRLLSSVQFRSVILASLSVVALSAATFSTPVAYGYNAKVQYQTELQKKLGVTEGISIRSWLAGDKNYKPPMINIPEICKNILPIRTLTSDYYGADGAQAAVQMLLKYRRVDLSQEQLATELNGAYTQAAMSKPTDISKVKESVNSHLFGYATPDSNYDPGYFLYNMNSETEPNRFRSMLKQNVIDGYPIIYHVDASYLYPGATGSKYVLGIGYRIAKLMDDQTQQNSPANIGRIYFLDPDQSRQDFYWGGLKYMDINDFIKAVQHSYSGCYIA